MGARKHEVLLLFCPWCNSTGTKQPVLCQLTPWVIYGQEVAVEYVCNRCKWCENYDAEMLLEIWETERTRGWL